MPLSYHHLLHVPPLKFMGSLLVFFPFAQQPERRLTWSPLCITTACLDLTQLPYEFVPRNADGGQEVILHRRSSLTNPHYASVWLCLRLLQIDPTEKPARCFMERPGLLFAKGGEKKCKKPSKKCRNNWLSVLHPQAGGAGWDNTSVCSDHSVKLA